MEYNEILISKTLKDVLGKYLRNFYEMLHFYQ